MSTHPLAARVSRASKAKAGKAKVKVGRSPHTRAVGAVRPLGFNVSLRK
jgi:hypothetical protein